MIEPSFDFRSIDFADNYLFLSFGNRIDNQSTIKIDT